jgi:hypothetical protein
LADVEFVEYQRRDFLEKAMVEELGRRAGERTVEPASIGCGIGGLAVETSRSPSDYLEP